MSYSFRVQGATKAEAKQKAGAELATVVRAQPIHSRDQAQAQAAADTFIDLLADDDTKDVVCVVYGSVSWTGTGADAVLTGASVAPSASLVTRG